ncbi:uncharacterized protein LOC119573748 [Penaeus monodon]|uniref:uncharacterized protein LOC119573748 n=1 Tax=Penaeus monodon TaxID=6687 RepID=UPI0018A72833|nr:uncharacterized protein LOC119573748 [Penaeus monodon]
MDSGMNFMQVYKVFLAVVMISLMTTSVSSEPQRSTLRTPDNLEGRQLPSILGVISPDTMPVYFSFVVIGASVIAIFVITAVLVNRNSLQGRELDLSRDLRDLTWSVYTALSKS